MEISHGLVNLMYFTLCGELNRIKGSRSDKRRKLLTYFTNSLFKVYNNLSLREIGPEVYNSTGIYVKNFGFNFCRTIFLISTVFLSLIFGTLLVINTLCSSLNFWNIIPNKCFMLVFNFSKHYP